MQPQAQDIIGQVAPPPGVAAFNAESGGTIGLFSFINTLVRFGTVIAGLFVLYNFFMAGFEYITGEGKGGEKARQRLTSSVIGMVIIVAAYTIIGLLGLIFFGNPTYFINPEICGPGGC